MNKAASVNTPMAQVYFENGILITELLPVDPTIEDAKTHTEMINEHFSNYNLVLSLTDASRSGQMNKTVRDYLASNSIATMKAVAVITGSGAARIAGNLFLQFFKPKYEIKMFTDKEKALEWLAQFK